MRPEGKLRMPAWCDRVLWRSGNINVKQRQANQRSPSLDRVDDNDKPLKSLIKHFSDLPECDDGIDEENVLKMPLEPVNEIVELMKYESVPKNIMSDHVPVRGLFNLRVKRFVALIIFMLLL